MRNSLIALSGGVDSTTLLYEYREEIACAVGFDYGSKHNARELAAAKAICRELEIPYLIIPLAFIGEYFRRGVSCYPRHRREQSANCALPLS